MLLSVFWTKSINNRTLGSNKEQEVFQQKVQSAMLFEKFYSFITHNVLATQVAIGGEA